MSFNAILATVCFVGIVGIFLGLDLMGVDAGSDPNDAE